MFHFLHLPSYALLRVTVYVTISFFLHSKGTTVFCKLELHVLREKKLLKIWRNPGLKLTNFWGTGPSNWICNCNSWVEAKTMLLQQCHPGLKLHKIYNGNNIINNNIILVSTIFQGSSIILNIILYWELRVTFIILPVCQTKCYLKLEILTG